MLALIGTTRKEPRLPWDISATVGESQTTIDTRKGSIYRSPAISPRTATSILPRTTHQRLSIMPQIQRSGMPQRVNRGSLTKELYLVVHTPVVLLISKLYELSHFDSEPFLLKPRRVARISCPAR
jgi:hypothetical protein